MTKTVFLLWHTHELSAGKEDTKLIGVYGSRDAAERAKARASELPGFSGNLTGFEISGYNIGEDQWREGFSTILSESPRQV